MVHLVLARLQLSHDRDKIVVYRTADATVREIVNLHTAFLPGGAQQSAVHGHLSKLIHENGEPALRVLFEQAANEGCFSGAEEAGDDRDWNLHGDDGVRVGIR